MTDHTLSSFPAYVCEEDINISENGLEILRRRYLRKGMDGAFLETPAQMFYRVARHVASADDEFSEDATPTTKMFYHLLTQMRFVPNSPTFTGADTPLNQLAACFVLPIEDDLGKSPDGIFSTLRNAALIQQTGGGNGFSFSRLRPRDDRVMTSAGVATGPVGFLEVYDKAFDIIKQGGTRRGANMAVLNIDHPDIEEFIKCKSKEGNITNFNISVGISDHFMEMVEEDGEMELVNPHDQAVWKKVRARELFDMIATYAHRNGEPGMLFLDTANKANPVPQQYKLEATNPCGEQYLGPYENCCLGSINLAHHVGYTEAGDPFVDWDLLQQTTEEAVHFLENVVTKNGYVPAVPKLREAALRNRRIGLGIMGLADIMYHLGIRYGSETSLEFASQIMEFVRYHAMRASIDFARRRGAFPGIKGSIYDPEKITWKPPTPFSPYTHDWGRPALDWDAIVQGIKQYGIRNAAQTTIAPTGTTGTVSGCEGYGCEPVFALAYYRHVQENDEDLTLTYVSPLFQKVLNKIDLTPEARQRIVDEVIHEGSCQGIDDLPDWIRETFVVAQDIAPAEHVRMQAALQRFVDNSISKTINMPATATVDDVKEVYKLAWRLGCKGLTVYVTGSRQEVVLETSRTAQQKKGTGDVVLQQSNLDAEIERAHKRRPRPAILHGMTYRQETPLGTAYMTVNISDGNEPFEAFLTVGKAGSDVAAVSEALGRLISYILRMPSNLNPRTRLEHIVYQLAGIGGGRSLGFGPKRVRSLPDAVAQVLDRFLKETEAVNVQPMEENVPAEQMELPIFQIGDICPECGQATLIYSEGCRKCYACGYSEC